MRRIFIKFINKKERFSIFESTDIFYKIIQKVLKDLSAANIKLFQIGLKHKIKNKNLSVFLLKKGYFARNFFYTSEHLQKIFLWTIYNFI